MISVFCGVAGRTRQSGSLGRAAASAAAGGAGGFGLLSPLGIGQGGLGVPLIGEAADPEGAAGFGGQADADQEISMVRALGQGRQLICAPQVGQRLSGPAMWARASSLPDRP